MCDQVALSDEVKMALRESPDRFASRLFTTSSAPPASQAASSRSIYQYLIKCRVDRAKELLQQKDSSIAETAQSVGFSSQSHLNRHFKRWLGVSPRSVQQR